MTSTSSVVNRALRESVTPALREVGFAKVDARNGWRWGDRVIWVFNIRAVGARFSSVTDWPPGSVGVWLGIFLTFMPRDYEIKVDEAGRTLPAEHACHIRSHLECGLDQRRMTDRLSSRLERRRKDIWWVEPDGSNASLVAADIAAALRTQGQRWFSRQSDLEFALADIEEAHDCYAKFDTAAFLSREVGDRERWKKYAALAATEGRRIGLDVDFRSRYRG